MANFDKETEKVWKFGQFWEGDLKGTKIWKILTSSVKEYENLANFDKEITYYRIIYFSRFCCGCDWKNGKWHKSGREEKIIGSRLQSEKDYKMLYNRV